VIHWINLHPLVLLVAGFLWLGIAVFWPDIRRQLPSIPQTIHQQVRGAEARIKDQESRLASIESRLKTGRVDKLFDNMENRTCLIAGVLDSSAYISVVLGELTVLISEAHCAVLDFERIRELGAGGVVSEHPISSWWLNADRSDELIRSGLALKFLLKRHEGQCHRFSDSCKINLEESPSTERLFSWVRAWGTLTEVTGEQFWSTLWEHQKALEQRRSDQARKLIGIAHSFTADPIE